MHVVNQKKDTSRDGSHGSLQMDKSESAWASLKRMAKLCNLPEEVGAMSKAVFSDLIRVLQDKNNANTLTATVVGRFEPLFEQALAACEAQSAAKDRVIDDIFADVAAKDREIKEMKEKIARAKTENTDLRSEIERQGRASRHESEANASAIADAEDRRRQLIARHDDALDAMRARLDDALLSARRHERRAQELEDAATERENTVRDLRREKLLKTDELLEMERKMSAMSMGRRAKPRPPSMPLSLLPPPHSDSLVTVAQHEENRAEKRKRVVVEAEASVSTVEK